MRSIILLALIVLLLSGCRGETQSNTALVNFSIAQIDEHKEPLPVKIVFASTLERGVHCSRDFPKGCDLYLAEYDLATNEVKSIKRLTYDNETEWFPVFDPDGRYILYEKLEDNKFSIKHIEISSLMSGMLVSGRFPDISHDGTKVAFSDPKGIHIAGLMSTDGIISILGDELIINGSDPQFSPDGKRVAYHLKLPDKSAATKIYDLSSKQESSMTGPIGCGHASFNIDGSLTICGLSSNTIIKAKNGELYDLIQDYPPAMFASSESKYSDCTSVIISYPEFCADNDFLIGSVQCLDQESRSVFSELFLFEFSQGNVILHNIHKDFENFLDVNDKESVTAACS